MSPIVQVVMLNDAGKRNCEFVLQIGDGREVRRLRCRSHRPRVATGQPTDYEASNSAHTDNRDERLGDDAIWKTKQDAEAKANGPSRRRERDHRNQKADREAIKERCNQRCALIGKGHGYHGRDSDRAIGEAGDDSESESRHVRAVVGGDLLRLEWPVT